MADEVAARARELGIKVAWGRCWEAGGAPAYWPWVESLRACVRGLGSEELRAYLGAGAPFVAQIVPEVAEILPDVRLPPPMGAEGGRFLLFDAVAAFLRNVGAVQPLMLVLDDLHAADTPSILLLRFAARAVQDAVRPAVSCPSLGRVAGVLRDGDARVVRRGDVLALVFWAIGERRRRTGQLGIAIPATILSAEPAKRDG